MKFFLSPNASPHSFCVSSVTWTLRSTSQWTIQYVMFIFVAFLWQLCPQNAPQETETWNCPSQFAFLVHKHKRRRKQLAHKWKIRHFTKLAIGVPMGVICSPRLSSVPALSTYGVLTDMFLARSSVVSLAEQKTHDYTDCWAANVAAHVSPVCQ